MDELVFKRGQCWRDASGCVRRLRDVDQGEAFEIWTSWEEWAPTWSPGVLPHTPCEDPSKPKPRGVWETVRWCYENEGRAAVPVSYPKACVVFDRAKGVMYTSTYYDWTEPLRPTCFADEQFLPVEGDWDDES